MQTSTRLLSLFGARMGARRVAALAMAAALGTLPFASACGTPQDDNSAAYLIIGSMQAASGADPTTFGTVLPSDVLTCVKKTGSLLYAQCNLQVDMEPHVLGDLGQVEFFLAMKDPSITTPSSANFITIEKYKVDFARTDGGAGTIPSFESGMSFTVTDKAVTAGFILVPPSIKAAPVLTALISQGAGASVTTTATITFSGKDQRGNKIQATTTIGVIFSDFVDPS